MKKVIVTCAIIGTGTTRERSPYPPMTPKEIADSAIESCKAGASVCHIHVRDLQTQEGSMKVELYEEVYNRVRDKCEIVINLTTGPGGRLIYDGKTGNWDTRELKSPEERVEHVLKLKPEICSLDIGTMNFGQRAFINLVSIIEKMARMVTDAGVKAELECFDAGHITIGKHLLEKGFVKSPPLFQLCLGIPWGIDATSENMLAMKKNLPENSDWCALGIGSQSFPMAALSMMNGGNARVGLEDNLYLKKGVLATSNAELVKKVVLIAENLGREVATPEEARKILNLKS